MRYGWIKSLMGLLVSLLFLYGVYWVTKTVSYEIFYEDMVKRTVRELVKPEALKIVE